MSVQHVYPVADLVEHNTESDDCVCGPDVEFVDGGQVVVHHSLDGREMCADCKRAAATTWDVALNEGGSRLGFCDDCAPKHGMFPGEN